MLMPHWPTLPDFALLVWSADRFVDGAAATAVMQACRHC